MAERRLNNSDNNFEQHSASARFLPNLCQPTAVLSLILVGELLALALALDDGGLKAFEWMTFGMHSFLVQWIMLCSAATLCAVNARLSRWSSAKAFLFSFFVVLSYTSVFSAIGQKLLLGTAVDPWVVLSNVGIAAIFSGVLMRYLYLQQKLKQQQEAELQARIQALQSRIRPHFLFNSLNSIASLITIKPEAAEKMVLDLSHLFRASLKMPRLIKIDEEIALCRCFADIEKIRLGARLNVNWNLQQLPPETQILNLLLQPLLENAIYHGIQPLPEGGTVEIELKELKADIVIKVSNPRQAELLNTTRADTGGNGIALANIRRRLDAYYGKDAYLRVVKGQHDFSVIVRYPARR
ncbi:sensor histidine kinase [Agaribacterium haliotis]|uniref:sensor histidine kinase n=1 Tax=Agaribacterium haliotis TaxID=2013869 RepID=UPI000BB57889|nr:histidine kinase [Agaribacterium haliotis]